MLDKDPLVAIDGTSFVADTFEVPQARPTPSQLPLVLFSGGLDSTVMLQMLLQQGDVHTLYVSGSQHPVKVEKELAARRKIIKKLEKITGNYVLRDFVISTGSLFDGDLPDRAWLQPLTWLVGALQVSDGRVHSNLHVGYVSGDGISSELHNIERAWFHSQQFTKQNPIGIIFPLKRMKKIEIMGRIAAELWDDVWVCESPIRQGCVVRSCDKCDACLTRAANMMIWERTRGKPFGDYIKLQKQINRLHRRKNARLPLLKEFS